MDVLLPKWGVTMQEATVDEWLVSEGEPVQAGQLIVRVGTDKVDTEVEAPASGVLRSIRVPEGEVAPVGAVLAVIDES
jgi:pyruvate/2-oxoglutarate dehydrogenase complex dihydrolipoamide acyltransferase (E2) component